MLTTYPWLSYALGYTIATFAAHFIVGPAVNKLWALTEADFQKKGISIKPVPIRVNPTVAFWHGVAERAIYATSVVLGKPEGIAVWLAFKAVIRWKMSEEEEPRHVPGAPIYMIGTAMNVGFGIMEASSLLRAGRFETRLRPLTNQSIIHLECGTVLRPRFSPIVQPRRGNVRMP